MTATTASQRATRREWAGLAVLALPTLLLSIDIFVLLLALPKIDVALHPSSTQQLWITDSYGFLLAGFLVTMGTLGVWMACFMSGAAIGPLVGGLLLEHYWWGSVFLLAVPVMVLLLVAGPVLLPEYRSPGAGRLEPGSVALSLCAVIPAFYGLTSLARYGWQPLPGAWLLVSAVAGVLFVRRQRSLAEPLLDLGLLASRTFSAAMAA
jgi:MFS family permease